MSCGNLGGILKGYQIVSIDQVEGTDRWKAILEPIPKPKRKVAIAEWDLREGETIAAIEGSICVGIGTAGRQSSGKRYADRTRIEERDA